MPRHGLRLVAQAHHQSFVAQSQQARRLQAHDGHATTPASNPKLSDNAKSDFVAVVLVGVTPNLLVCDNDQPAKAVKDVIALCKSRPGHITFSSAGPASAQHLAPRLFMHQARVFALHIPYQGSAPLIVELIGCQMQYSFDTMTAATPHLKSGKLFAVAQTRPQRSKRLPQRADHGRVWLPRL